MSNMNNMSDDETKAVGMWDRTKAWANKNRTISGALVGGAAFRQSYNVFRDSPIKRGRTMCEAIRLSPMEGTSP